MHFKLVLVFLEMVNSHMNKLQGTCFIFYFLFWELYYGRYYKVAFVRWKNLWLSKLWHARIELFNGKGGLIEGCIQRIDRTGLDFVALEDPKLVLPQNTYWHVFAAFGKFLWYSVESVHKIGCTVSRLRVCHLIF